MEQGLFDRLKRLRARHILSGPAKETPNSDVTNHRHVLATFSASVNFKQIFVQLQADRRALNVESTQEKRKYAGK